jgi:hypothetical protein
VSDFSGDRGATAGTRRERRAPRQASPGAAHARPRHSAVDLPTQAGDATRPLGFRGRRRTQRTERATSLIARVQGAAAPSAVAPKPSARPTPEPPAPTRRTAFPDFVEFLTSQPAPIYLRSASQGRGPGAAPPVTVRECPAWDARQGTHGGEMSLGASRTVTASQRDASQRPPALLGPLCPTSHTQTWVNPTDSKENR